LDAKHCVDQEVHFDRDALLADFKADNIDGRVFFWPLSIIADVRKKPEMK